MHRRTEKPTSKTLLSEIDRAVALADREVGIQHSEFSIQNSGAAQSPITNHQSPIAKSSQSAIDNRQSAIPVAPVDPVPPTPEPERISAAAYTERLRAGWVPVMGLSGTPITSGFIRDLGEYNPKLEGLNGIWTYQEMRRGDGQVAGTLRACKLPILSAKWEIVPGDAGGTATPGGKSAGAGRSARATVSSTGAGQPTADKAKEVADFVRENLFNGLEWQDSRGS